MEAVYEAHLSTQQPPPQEDARVPRPDEHRGWPASAEQKARQGPEATGGVTSGQRFRPQDRIRKRSEYKVIYERGRKIPSKNIVVFVARNAMGRPRLGITVTRRLGGAVHRNRAKRLIREVFRRHKSELQDVDIVVNGKIGLPAARFTPLETEFLECLKSYRKGR